MKSAMSVTAAVVLHNQRISRARESLYRGPVNLSPARQFLFAGWLRVEAEARRLMDEALLEWAFPGESSGAGR